MRAQQHVTTSLLLFAFACAAGGFRATEEVSLLLAGDTNINATVGAGGEGDLELPWKGLRAAIEESDLFLLNHEATVTDRYASTPGTCHWTCVRESRVPMCHRWDTRVRPPPPRARTATGRPLSRAANPQNKTECGADNISPPGCVKDLRTALAAAPTFKAGAHSTHGPHRAS